MEVLVLFGSPHQHGPTARLTEAFLAPLGALGARVSRVDLYPLNPAPCTACGFCKTAEGCAFSDLDQVHRLLLSCGLLVLAAPVYNAGLPAPAKALLDRWQRYFEARFSRGKRPAIATHREAVLLLTRGSAEDLGDAHIAAQVQRAFTVMNTSLTGTVVWPETDAGEARMAPALAQARQLGLAIGDKLCYNTTVKNPPEIG